MRHPGHAKPRPNGSGKLVKVYVHTGVKCRTCNGRGWIDEECESGIAGISVPRHLRPICDDCDGKGYKTR